MLSEATKHPKAQPGIVRPLTINYDRFKESDIPDTAMRVQLNTAWRAFDGLIAIGRVLEANEAERVAQDDPIVLDDRVTAGLLNAVVVLAEIGRSQVDGCGGRINAKRHG